MNAFPPNWVREVISWIPKLNRAGMPASHTVVRLPKNRPSPSAGGKKLRLQLLIPLGSKLCGGDGRGSFAAEVPQARP